MLPVGHPASPSISPRLASGARLGRRISDLGYGAALAAVALVLAGCGEDGQGLSSASVPLVSAPTAAQSVAAPAQAVVTYSAIQVGDFSGPVTSTEIASFRDYMSTLTPATDNIGNTWAQGKSGEQTKALGLVYEVGRDLATLNQMIRFCDAVLSERNDIAPPPVGGHAIWSDVGTQHSPVWPNVAETAAAPKIGTGGEQGDPPGHLGNCARLILQTPAIYNVTVPIGDPYKFGTTYLQRAKRYVAEADYSIDQHILGKEIVLDSSNHQYFSSADPYKPGLAVPWNQQMMFNYAFQNLATAHEILGDAPSRVARYRQIEKASFDWFFSVAKTYTDAAGNPAFNWGYTADSASVEDQNHASLDIAGIARAYRDGHFGITATQMTEMANTISDVLMLAPASYAGFVDGTEGSGHSAATDYLRAGFIYPLEFRDDKLVQLLQDGGVTANTASTNYAAASAWFWVKYRRSLR